VHRKGGESVPGEEKEGEEGEDGVGGCVDGNPFFFFFFSFFSFFSSWLSLFFSLLLPHPFLHHPFLQRNSHRLIHHWKDHYIDSKRDIWKFLSCSHILLLFLLLLLLFFFFFSPDLAFLSLFLAESMGGRGRGGGLRGRERGCIRRERGRWWSLSQQQ
jgi:hypothetical protein